jgi:hypothetical protein
VRTEDCRTTDRRFLSEDERAAEDKEHPMSQKLAPAFAQRGHVPARRRRENGLCAAFYLLAHGSREPSTKVLMRVRLVNTSGSVSRFPPTGGFHHGGVGGPPITRALRRRI